MNTLEQSFEKLGVFYLGKRYDSEAAEVAEDLLLYDSKDLVTHGVVLGMTGSGKTGLCISLLEEAALDDIPALIVDPKGDIANLLLTFPNLASEDFAPWVNPEEAARKGMDVADFAKTQAELWRQGLDQWGQDGSRIAALRSKVEPCVYTPGSSAGMPLSVLNSLHAPSAEVIEDDEMLADSIESTVSSLLSLLGIAADPLRSREHIFLSTILHHFWKRAESIDLPSLIRLIQEPPFSTVGVLPLDDFYKERDRQELAMMLNNLLAAPSFQTWLQGEPLDIASLLYTPEGKPRQAIFSIAHLSDAERMFFVSLLFNEIVSWMRSQPGTASLRAILYMDEIFGYLPPTANPPSKKPLMTMLKQARAYGLGVLLASQNPVDLDYKALSNIGTWFLGRLSTERDRDRVLAGLEGSLQNSANNSRRDWEKRLGSLRSRVFVLHNVHEDGPETFHVRWAMSYLRGPLTKSQIRTLMEPMKRERKEEGKQSIQSAPPSFTDIEQGVSASEQSLPSGVNSFYLAPRLGLENETIHYVPKRWGSAQILFADRSKKIHAMEIVDFVADWGGLTEEASWERAQKLTVPREHILPSMPEGMDEKMPLPAAASQRGYFNASIFRDWLFHRYRRHLLYCAQLKQSSHFGESEGAFRGRLQHIMREKRDGEVEVLRSSYTQKIKRLEEQMERAQEKVDTQQAQAQQAQMDTAVSMGASIIDALLGRKRRTYSGGRRSARRASRAWRESRDVAKAKAKVDELIETKKELEQELMQKIELVSSEWNAQRVPLERREIAPLKKNIAVREMEVLWMPYRREGERFYPAWEGEEGALNAGSA